MNKVNCRDKQTPRVHFLSDCDRPYSRTKGLHLSFLYPKRIFPVIGAIGVMVCSVLLYGCSNPAGGGKIEPITFDHADEWAIQGGFAALADQRIFALMAFLNVVGYDQEHPDFQMHPVRVKVRELVRKNIESYPEKFKAWQDYYQKHRGAQLFGLKSFVLALSPDYPFRKVVPDNQLGYPWTGQFLKDLPDILNDFWVSANLDDVWNQVKPDYIQEIRKYDLAKMEREMAFLWSYLRMQRRDSAIIVNVPDLLDHHLGAMGAGYGEYYFSVENQGNGGYGLNVHEYLHSVINPIVEKHYGRYKAKLDAYYIAGKDFPGSRDYQNPVTFAYECMVGALDRRIRVLLENDPKWTNLCEGQVAFDTQEGLLLTQPFYRLLADYEASGQSFDQYLPTLLKQLPEYDPNKSPRTMTGEKK
ncbi:MAG: DUF4932 domain-containing protein [Phycisphaerae bacterium]|nr:DUF4932 domain-containing protein [Phycisphaerae bacterium]